MANNFEFRNTLPSNFPQKVVSRSPEVTSFPEDLVIAGKRNFYTQIQFVKYNTVVGGILDTLVGGVGNTITPQGGMYLPIPRKLDDQNIVSWTQDSGLDRTAQIANMAALAARGAAGLGRLGAAASAISAGGSMAAALTGMTVNPFLFMKFNSPSFKQFTLSWTLAPSNENESKIIRGIIYQFKYNMLPEINFLPIFMNYPSIALIKFYPDDKFLFPIKPCAIEAVSVDYTAAGGPSFFKNGAPTVVNLSVRFKEIELWTKNNYKNG